MNNLKYVKHEKMWLKGHALYNEKWLQNIIADDPSILGLGDLILKDKEKTQPTGGRLDLLLQDSDTNQRYEVEIQLGRTDETHIIRTIEYWDIERKRYPQYDHIAVIIAEDITSRFLNVINLFNGHIPLIAIQLNAIKSEDNVSLVFTMVLDQMTLGFAEEDEEQEPVNRAYWEQRSTKEILTVADQMLELIRSFAPDCNLKYNKFYIGLAQNGQTNNFVVFKPKKKFIRFEPKLKKNEELEDKINDTGLDLIDYTKSGRYRIRLVKNDIENNVELLKELMHQAYTS